MLKRRSRRVMNEINVVPYIDVMLVLLVIFMVTTPMFSVGVIDLPTVSVTTQARKETILLTINVSNEMMLTFEGKTYPISSDRSDLITKIKSLSEDSTLPVVIAADKSLNYGDVMTLLDTLKGAGITRLSLMTKTDEHP